MMLRAMWWGFGPRYGACSDWWHNGVVMCTHLVHWSGHVAGPGLPLLGLWCHVGFGINTNKHVYIGVKLMIVYFICRHVYEHVHDYV